MLPDHPPAEFLHRRADSLTHATPLLQADLRTDLVEVGRSLLSELPKPKLGPPISLMAWLLWLRTHTVPFVSTWRFVSIPIHANERTKSTWHTPGLRDIRSGTDTASLHCECRRYREKESNLRLPVQSRPLGHRAVPDWETVGLEPTSSGL